MSSQYESLKWVGFISHVHLGRHVDRFPISASSLKPVNWELSMHWRIPDGHVWWRGGEELCFYNEEVLSTCRCGHSVGL